MATIRTAIQIQDNMSKAFQSMNNAMNIVINSFESLQSASSNAVEVESIQAARRELNQAEIAFNEVEQSIIQSNEAQQEFNQSVNNGHSAVNGLVGKVQALVGAYLSFQGLKSGAGLINDWLGSADVINKAETQLASVMANMGATRAEFESLKDKAAEVEGFSTFGTETVLAGAGELATYLQSGKAIEAMMNTMADYAAGMGGINVDDRQMVEYATQLGKALDGQFDGLRKKGFIASDAQKKILETGSELERVAVITDIIAQSWDGLAEAMANTPQGQIVQMQNNFDGIKQKVGNELYPAVVEFFNIINSNMPTIEALMMGFAHAAEVVMVVLGGIIEAASWVASIFIDNWSIIGPIIMGVAGAILLYGAYLGMINLWTHLVTAAQWLWNAAMTANPIGLIIAGIALLIGLFYALIGAINKSAGTSISATGIIAGAFAVLGAFIWNTVVGVINAIIQFLWTGFVEPWIGIIEWVLNVFNGGFNSFGDAVANLLGQIISWFLSLGKVVTNIIDSIFGTNWTAGLSSLQDSVLAWGKNEAAITLDRKAPMIESRIEYGKAWDAGYDWGANLFKNDPREKQDPLQNIWDQANLNSLATDGANTAANTAKMAKSMEGSEEDLKYLRDLAERDVINRFTTAEVKVDMTNHNTVNSDLDLDGIIDKFGEKLEETLDVIAEGV